MNYWGPSAPTALTGNTPPYLSPPGFSFRKSHKFRTFSKIYGKIPNPSIYMPVSV